ncbi:MAG: [FeFe] hydrogenase H-cluster maturation GTPase HydF [Oscillospiraceae bacterium]|nr:[FeFe] hydrogenase H-cluster maturation GTPase HydF [Oscillospiraceae bacterium]
MSLNDTPSGERVHIGFFGRRNVGKSSLVNAITGQNLSVVSEIKGTTTDPVRKAMELLPLGPVLIIDTPGFDDEGSLGALRVAKTREVLEETDIAVLVAEAHAGLTAADAELLSLFQAQGIPHLVVLNKFDLSSSQSVVQNDHQLAVSAATGYHIEECKERLARMAPSRAPRELLSDLVESGDIVVLVTPIDSAAPKGRMILPQMQAVRAVLDAGAINVVVREFELAQALALLQRPPALVITDSQAFEFVSQIVPREVPLTSFSILFARYKGFLEEAVRGVRALNGLPEGANILIAEGCTHHRQCDDIGTVKLPRWIQAHAQKEVSFHFCSGREFPENLRGYDLILHCGGCMLNERALLSRQRAAQAQGVPFTNYGVAIAFLNGILERCLLNGQLVTYNA